MNIAKLIKNEVKRMGFGNVKYHSFKGRSYETLKFYTCSPNDQQVSDLNWFIYNSEVAGSAKRVYTTKHPEGFLEIMYKE